MYPLLDHEDFQKSRKALMATSAFVILVHKLHFTGSTIQISGVNLSIDTEVLTGFSNLFLLYFLYVFLMRAFDHYVSGSFERVLARIEEIKAARKEIEERHARLANKQRLIATEEDEERRFSDQMQSLLYIYPQLAKFSRASVVIGVDLIPAIFLAAWALKSAGSLNAILTFLHAGT